PAFCKMGSDFGSSVQVSCSSRLLISSDFSLFSVAAACDVSRQQAGRGAATTTTTKLLLMLGSFVIVLAGIATVVRSPWDQESVLSST
ncbi:hypothetical protein PENTCL1PPCAC_29357, partial [Pristionchus entomophagus]